MKSVSALVWIIILSGCSSKRPGGWSLAFSDSGTADWTDNWFLEGAEATVINSEEGMQLSAGPVPGEDASHAVLWTKRIFDGDLKIEYRYTRLDTMTAVNAVNILYIQASGLGTEAAPTDIAESSAQRAVPAMTEYYLNMNAFQISYATTGPGMVPYVGARHYPASSQSSFPTETRLPPLYEDVELFEPGKSYSIAAVKEQGQLTFSVSGDGVDEKFVWDTSGFPHIVSGRVGLRHMWARSALYSDLKIYAKEDRGVPPSD